MFRSTSEAAMNFEFSPEDEAFRHDVREFIAASLPPDVAEDTRRWMNPTAARFRRWQGILAAKGWGAPHWPVDYGGTDWHPLRKHIFMQEVYRADAPDFGWQGLYMMGPVLIAFGSAEQKVRFLPKILSGEEMWCQGFSEPGAGSDLANLRTTAVLEGDHYIVQGQKLWTSDAQDAEWGFFLVRTDTGGKPQRGLSLLAVRMATPGITVRAIRSIDGRTELNEVFLDKVRVPRENLIGEAGQGWTYAKYLLEKERTASAFLYFNQRQLAKAKCIASALRAGQVRLIDTAAFSRKLARVEADLHALEWSVLRLLAHETNKYPMTAVVSALKIRGSEMQQRISELLIDALGPLALRHFERGAGEQNDWPEFAVGATSIFLNARAATIYGGAREVQKNIIAKAAFGLST